MRWSWRIALTAGGISAAAGCAGPGAAVPPPDADGGCCRALEYLYEASIFRIDVMRIRVRVDDGTASAVAGIVRDARRSATLEEQVAARYMAAPEAVVETEFRMGMSGKTFVDNTVEAIRGLAADGLVSGDEADRLAAGARSRFGFLHDAGVRRGDRIEYDLVADTVTTVYRRAGSALMRDRQVGALFRTALLASYFAPSSDFRRGLLDRVFAR